MTTADTDQPSEETPPSDPEVRTRRARVVRGATNAVDVARTSVASFIERAPGAADATRAGVRRTTSALQRLPDSTLRWLTAGSVGLAAGLKLAGAPRLVTAAGAAPALIMGAAIALRSTEAASPPHDQAEESEGGTIDMSSEHTKGVISTTQGKVEEAVGKLTGDKEAQAHGKAKQVQGDAQDALGDIQDAVREPEHQEKEGA